MRAGYIYSLLSDMADSDFLWGIKPIQMNLHQI
jgi:hypothetical protein